MLEKNPKERYTMQQI